MEDDKMKEWIDELSDQELIHCARAAGLADTEPSHPADMERAARFVGSHISQKKNHRLVFWTSASLLAVAAGLAIVFLPVRQSRTAPSEMIAETQNVVEEQIVSEEEPSVDLVEESRKSEAQPAKESRPGKEMILKEGLEGKTYAAETEMRDFQPIKPDKTEYKIRVVNEDKSFTFRWDSSELASMELILQDEEGKFNETHQFTDEDHFDFPAKTGVLYHAIHWKMKVQYKDGAEGVKSGIIYFDKVKE